MIAVPTEQSDAEMEHFYSQSFKANHCGNVNNNGKLCINALRAKMIASISDWFLVCPWL